MEGKGMQVDFTTLRPSEQVAGEKEDLRKRKEEATLRDKANFLGIVESPEGQELIAIIEARLMERISTLVREDAQASAYHKLLQDLGHKKDIAAKAIATLYGKQLKVKR